MELESVLLSHPDIQDAAVVGVPDTLGGELPLAFVVKKADSDVCENTIIQFVKGEFGSYVIMLTDRLTL